MSMITKQGEKASSFAMTCNLLSQYIKEKGRPLGELGFGLAPRPIDSSIFKNGPYRPPATMSLLPGVDVSENDTNEIVSERNATKSMDLFPQSVGFGSQTPASAESREPENSQLTIFYGGKVLVFDNFPEDKARDLMMLAGKGSSPSKNTGFAPQPVASSSAAAEPKNPTSLAQPCPPRPTDQNIVCDLPIARKASLHRFLEKRKDRINSRAPYQMNPVKDSPKMEKRQPWLGLNPSLMSSDCRR